MNMLGSLAEPNKTAPDPGPVPPLQRFLWDRHAEFGGDFSGAVANYIPELTKANPASFGMALATIDGHIYDAGDATLPFTIQSVSKAFVFGLALEILGGDRVEAVIGVEPSGEAFNSINLNAKNQPFNPMVNAGAIACSGLICEAEGKNAFARILDTLSSFAGRALDVDEQVYASEGATGDRNRAIAWLLRNHGVVKADVNTALDVYFRQCAVLVTARDLAVMAATLANGGINPVTRRRVISPYAVSRTLSIMMSSGMYDYAGEWVYRVGIPAKSGVGGGIMAALPSQFGIGTYSPLLDEHGNSVRGLKFCNAISSHFDLHVLNRPGDVNTSVVADYDVGRLARRGRMPHEQKILDANEDAIRILELTGTLTFGNVDHIARRIHSRTLPAFVVLDFRRVPIVSSAAATLLAELFADLAAHGTRPVLSGLERNADNWTRIASQLPDASVTRSFALLNEAIEWSEDQIIFRYGGFSHLEAPPDLNSQALLADLEPEAVAELERHCATRRYHTGERIIKAGDETSSLFFLQRGMVSVKLATGVRLATFVPGTAFGEMALITKPRSADVWADSAVECLELSVEDFDRFRLDHPAAGQLIMRNLAGLLAKRLSQANTKIDLLSAN